MDFYFKLRGITLEVLIHLILGSLVLMSCDKTEDAGPMPIVQLIEPDNDAPLSNIVRIKAELEPMASLISINLEVDGVSDTVLTTSTIDFEWDSRKTADGFHDFKLIIETEKGHKIEFPFRREVKNILFDLTVSNNYVEPGATMYILVNNESGKLISYYQLQNGLRLPFLVPESHVWNDSRYSITLFYYDPLMNQYFKQTYNTTYLQTFVEIEPGSIFLDRQVQTTLSIKGNHKLLISDIPGSYDDFGVLGKGVGGFAATGFVPSTLTVTVPMPYTESDLTYFMVIGEKSQILKISWGDGWHFPECNVW